MKLLYDQNLSRRLVGLLEDCYPGSTHVIAVNLASASDGEVWAFAANSSYTIVSKDSDFHQRSLLHGPPPKVVWLNLGNCTTVTVEGVLRRHQADLETLLTDEHAAFLIIDEA